MKMAFQNKKWNTIIAVWATFEEGINFTVSYVDLIDVPARCP